MVPIDWKSYYRSEMEAPRAREILADCFGRVEVDETIDRLLAQRAILSFPHTALSYAGPLQARVVAGLVRAGVERVIALGVFHASALPPAAETDRRLLADDSAVPEARREAFARLGGGFMPPDRAARTPFGDVPLISVAEEDGVRVDRQGLLAHEFSLDTFFSLLAFHAAETGRRAPSVLPLFVGPTRDPVTGGFETAERIAEAVAGWRSAGTAVVTTGDLVHYGTAYGPAERMAGKPTDPAELEAFFARETADALDLAFAAGDRAAAYERAATVLQNDQRNILPVLTRLLRRGADYRTLAFSLSDYAGILEVADPCVVASALVAFVPAASG